MFEKKIEISFGDCDPAGIVFYPNYYRWFDATFQSMLLNKGLSQKILGEKIATVGTGLIDTGATFRSPAMYGQTLSMQLSITEWKERTFKITYKGFIGERLCVEGFELRGVFILQDGKLKTGPVEPLRNLIE